MEPSRILIGDTIEQMGTLPEKCVQCCVTSPPYWGLRDYGVDGQIGLEETPEQFVAKMVEVGRAVHRVLRDDGTFWLNIGDSYSANPCKSHGYKDGRANRAERLSPGLVAGIKPKDLCMMPWRVAMALQADGWWIRSVIVWAKKSPMPESCTDRPTSSWEPIFLLSKSEKYFYDAEAVKEPLKESSVGRLSQDVENQAGSLRANGGTKTNGPMKAVGRMPPIGGIKHAGSNGNPTYSGDEPEWPSGRNQRNVWHLGSEPYKEAHFATFPTEIPRRAIKAGTSEKGCCPACRAPWMRITEKTKITRERPNDFTKRSGEEGTGNSCANSVAGVSTKTIGWEPTCKCDAGDPVPCLVLDPFLGSGTTVAVARELGRHGVGCELNPEYAKLAARRIGKAERPETYRDESVVGDAPLFVSAAGGEMDQP